MQRDRGNRSRPFGIGIICLAVGGLLLAAAPTSAAVQPSPGVQDLQHNADLDAAQRGIAHGQAPPAQCGEPPNPGSRYGWVFASPGPHRGFLVLNARFGAAGVVIAPGLVDRYVTLWTPTPDVLDDATATVQQTAVEPQPYTFTLLGTCGPPPTLLTVDKLMTGPDAPLTWSHSFYGDPGIGAFSLTDVVPSTGPMTVPGMTAITVSEDDAQGATSMSIECSGDLVGVPVRQPLSVTLVIAEGGDARCTFTNDHTTTTTTTTTSTTSTTTTTTPTTTTEPPVFPTTTTTTSTTTTSTTTTVPVPTTTIPPSPTTTLGTTPPDVEPDTEVAGDQAVPTLSPSTAPATTPPEVLGVSVGPTLPRTGVVAERLMILGVALVLAGVTLLVGSQHPATAASTIGQRSSAERRRTDRRT